MPPSGFMEVVSGGQLDAFEARCLERLESGDLQLAELVAPFEHLDAAGQAERVAALAQIVLENTDAQSDPAAALALARIALTADPRNAELRQLTVAAYRAAYAGTPGLDGLLAAAGLTGARPARNALSAVDLCLTLKEGDALLSRAEDLVVEVVEVDIEHGLCTLRRAGRSTTIPAAELASGYVRLEPDDFRVLRQLRPQRLGELMQSDPVALVIGVVRAHDGLLDADMLKHELVPRQLVAKDWSRWWSKTRALLKRCPHVTVEGRAPVLLRYCAEGRTLEDETWAAFAEHTEPIRWLRTIEAYLGEKRQRKETLDNGLLQRLRAHLVKHVGVVEQLRPTEALAAALVIDRLDQSRDREGAVDREDAVSDREAAGPAVSMLRQAGDPAALIGGLQDDALWKLALDALAGARPDDGPACAVRTMDRAPASLLDRIVAAGLAGGLRDPVQQHIDEALAEPVYHPELIYWLWKGPQHSEELNLPPPVELFTEIVDALSALGRTVTTSAQATRDFRQRMRAALGLRDYAQVRACLQRVPPERAVTLRRQLERLDGIGDNARLRMLNMLREAHPKLWETSVRPPEAWEDPEVLWSTPEGLRRKTEERDRLVNVTMRENARRIGEAASHGDLSENSEYRFALEERDLLRARLAQINAELAKARTLELHRVPTEHVGVGSRVTLRNLADGAQRVMTFLGPFDADVDRGVYSYLAPVAQKLMGIRVGGGVTLTMDGRDAQFEVVAVANGLTGGDSP
jgi:transcription elongation factor GreA